MFYVELSTYIDECKKQANLVKITPEIDTNTGVEDDEIVKTKEVYEFYSEDGYEDESDCSDALAAAEAFIKACCAKTNCIEHKKKFKKGKYNKKEDVITECGKFIVTVAFTHN